MLGCCGCGGETWWCLHEDAIRVVVVGKPGSGKTYARLLLFNACLVRDEKPQRGNTLAKMEPRVVELGGTTLHIWEEPAPPSGVRWALDYKGPEYARVQPDVIVYTFSVAESFYDVTFELPNRCRGRTAYGADFTIPLIVVGTMADLRHAYEHERKLITDREVIVIMKKMKIMMEMTMKKKVSALYYVEVSARERTNIDLLWDVLAKSKSMRHWIEVREFRNRRLGLSPPEGTADDVPLLPSEDRSRCILS